MKKNYLFAISAVLIWSTMAPLAKAVLTDVPNMEALCISGLFAFAFLLLLNLGKRKAAKIREYSFRQIGAMCALGFLGMFLYTALYYYGLSVLSSQEACILNYLWPVMLVVFSCILLKEKLTAKKIIAIVCSFIGIIILSAENLSAGGSGRLPGMLSCILAAACYGLYSVLNKKADMDQDLTMTVIWLVVAVCAGIFGLLTETWIMPRGAQWLAIGWLGVMTDAVAYLLWALSLQGLDNVAPIANLAYLTPFLSLLLSALFLKEPVRPRAVIALLFIVGGILFQRIRLRSEKAADAAPESGHAINKSGKT